MENSRQFDGCAEDDLREGDNKQDFTVLQAVSDEEVSPMINDDCFKKNPGVESSLPPDWASARASIQSAYCQFREDLEGLIDQGLEGEYVAYSGTKLLSTSADADALFDAYEDLYFAGDLFVRQISLHGNEVTMGL